MATHVELKGFKHGEIEIGNGRKKKDHNGLSTLDETAKDLNMSTTNLKRALRIERNLTDSMKELLDTGEVTKTFASDIKQPIQIQNSSKKEKALYAIIIFQMCNLTTSDDNNAIQGDFIFRKYIIA